MGVLKPLNSQDGRPKSIEGENKSRKSIGEGVCSWKDNKEGYDEEKIDFTRNASLVIEQEEEEVQNVSLENLHEAQSKKKEQTKEKKSMSPNVKLDIKMRKASEPNSNGLVSPVNKRGTPRKSTLKVISPITKELKISPRNDKKLKVLEFGEVEKQKNKTLDSSNKFSWDKFTNQPSDIRSVYSQRQTLFPHFVSMSRTMTEPQSSPEKTKFSMYSSYKGPSTILNRKQVSEPSVMMKTSLPRWDLSVKRDYNEEYPVVAKKYANLSLREALLSPVSLSRQGKRQVGKGKNKEKHVHTLRNDTLGK